MLGSSVDVSGEDLNPQEVEVILQVQGAQQPDR